MINSVLQNVTAYRLWQAPFAHTKFAPLLQHNDLRRIRHVLDVGCGPGTNAGQFTHCEYLGVDWNQSYINYASRRYGPRFIAANVLDYEPSANTLYDFILVNSFFHHIDDANTARVLTKLATLLAPEGHIHILDLVLPQNPSISRILARLDRGQFARPLEMWRRLFLEAFDPVVFEPHNMSYFGVTLWNMVYFKGKAHA